MSVNVLCLSREVLILSRVFPWHMAQKVVCFSLCYYALLIWQLQLPLPCLRNQRFAAFQLAQGGPQCSDRRALCWGTPNKRSALVWVCHAPRLDPDPAPFQSLCAAANRVRRLVGVRLLRSFTALPSACALRLPSNQVAGGDRCHDTVLPCLEIRTLC